MTSVASFTLVMAIWPPRPTQLRVEFPQTNVSRAASSQAATGNAKDTATATWSQRVMAKDNLEGFRQRLMQAQQPKASANVGWVRWRSEVAEFYATAEQSRGDTTARGDMTDQDAASPVKFASHSKQASPKRAAWADFWAAEKQRTNEWLEGYEQANRERIELFAQSIRVEPLPISWPSRAWYWATGIGLAVAISGWLWADAFPARQLKPASLGFDSGDNIERSESTSDWAEMAFRTEWVAVRQPTGVWARRLAGSGVIAVATVVVAARVMGAF